MHEIWSKLVRLECEESYPLSLSRCSPPLLRYVSFWQWWLCVTLWFLSEMEIRSSIRLPHQVWTVDPCTLPWISTPSYTFNPFNYLSHLFPYITYNGHISHPDRNLSGADVCVSVLFRWGCFGKRSQKSGLCVHSKNATFCHHRSGQCVFKLCVFVCVWLWESLLHQIQVQIGLILPAFVWNQCMRLNTSQNLPRAYTCKVGCCLPILLDLLKFEQLAVVYFVWFSSCF